MEEVGWREYEEVLVQKKYRWRKGVGENHSCPDGDALGMWLVVGNSKVGENPMKL